MRCWKLGAIVEPMPRMDARNRIGKRPFTARHRPPRTTHTTLTVLRSCCCRACEARGTSLRFSQGPMFESMSAVAAVLWWVGACASTANRVPALSVCSNGDGSR